MFIIIIIIIIVIIIIILNKLLWDFPIQTDHKIEHNRPDIIVIDKKERNCTIINIACPFDRGISHKKKKQEKIEKYQDLKR